ncbi:MAG: glycosyltransferase family 2 protein [Bacteroidales bacterium]|jgi:glycosyltransferase involved in cell wall biosynthesis|nr:glycosyltransferase family 2 protein [Bacteroidales bacterium]
MQLSIITINLNNAHGLQQTIQSVQKQIFPDFEYIIIDGASTDASLEVLEANKGMLTYCISEPDTGVYNAMNKGIQQATGEYCLFLNSGDCLCEANTLQNIFSHNPTQDIIYGDSLNGDIYCRYPEYLTPLYLFRKPVLHQASFIKRNLFDRFGLYNESYKIVSDWDFFLKTLYQAQVSYRYIPNIPIVRFDMGGINNTQQQLLAQEKEQMLRNIFAEKYDEYKRYDAMWAELQEAQEIIKKTGHIQYSLDYKIGNVLLWPVRKIKKIINH